jgi:uncharacterized protein
VPELAGPRPRGERLEVLDAVRGLALLGILVVNSLLYFWPVHAVALGLPEPATGLDRASAWLVRFAFEGKYFTLFSLLFGIGITMQLARGHPPRRIVRRLAVLAGFGALHVTLLWWGDILLHYALLGGVVVLTRDWAPRRLERTAFIVLAVPVALQLALVALTGLMAVAPGGGDATDAALRATFATFRAEHEAALVTYTSRDVAAMATRRWADWGFATLGTLFNGMLLIVVAMFLLGAAAQRRGWTAPDARPHWRAVLARVLPVALVANAAYATLMVGADAYVGGWRTLAVTLAFVVGAPSGALTIASAAALALSPGGLVARALAAVGRLALSTYLLQSLVFATLAYGVGLGLYGRVHHAQALGLALLVYALQVFLAQAWAKRFDFGPLEWLWRALTYGRRPA